MIPKGRKPDRQEVSRLRRLFPSLGEFAITGPPDVAYNCVGWTVGEHRWIEPGKNLADVDRFYLARAFRVVMVHPVGEQVVAAFAREGRFTHASLRLESDPEWWESKLGQSWRVVHRLGGLEGNRYGRVVRFYAKRKGSP
jgi:hypothetical protein